MGSSITAFRLAPAFEDVLECLPISQATEFEEGQIIYSPDNISRSVYLVLAGKVGISRIAVDGSEVLLEIVRPDEMFGGSAFLAGPHPSEQAKAIEKGEFMAWAVSDMEDLVTKRPRLAVAMLQILAQRGEELARRIESFALDSIEQRLARSLIHFADRMGTQTEDGAVQMIAMTHKLLSTYVGTTREIVTHHMNRFRKMGYVDYSRHSILLYRDGLLKLAS